MTILQKLNLATGVLALLGTQAQAGIAGSAHDLSAKGYGSTELCIFCHAPHNASATKIAPLWNHASSTATYTLYSSPSMKGAVAQPGATSSTKACLSCHDGTVAVDNFGGKTDGTKLLSGGELIGTDLSNDHPVSFKYNAALVAAAGHLVTPASASQVTANIPLFGEYLECASCHDVHTEGTGKFLRVDNTGSALCLTCHVK
jgi:predicted CXXCH cytochrome family protein